MAKITVSREHVIAYPSLKDQLGKTVDASVIQKAAHEAKVAKKDAAKKAPAQAAAPKAENTKVSRTPKAAPRKRAAAKKTAKKSSK